MSHEIVSQGPPAPGSRHARHALATVQHGERVIRHLASTTNLLISGTSLLLRGNGPIADYLRPTLRAIGARVLSETSVALPTLPPASLRYVIDTGETGTPTGPANLPRIGPKTLLVDAGTIHPGIDIESFDIASLNAGFVPDNPRPGVTRYRLGATEVLVVPKPGEESELLNTSGLRLGDLAGAHESPVSAEAGRNRIAWASRFMPVTQALCAELRESGRLSGLRVGMCLILEPKTAVLALNLAAAGAEVTVFCPGTETDDDTAAALAEAGVTVLAHSGSTPAEERAAVLRLLGWKPNLIIDDGSNLIRLAHSEMPHILDTVIGAAEETTSGLRPLRVMATAGELRIPVIAVNDARCKTLFDNAHGTGQSTVLAILDLLSGLHSTPLTATRVVVAGYGPVGRGVARHVTALGGRVTVCETDPVRAAEATFDGHPVAPLTKAVSEAAIIISATGIADTITVEALSAALEGAVLAVAGGVDQEISINAALAAGATLTPLAKHISALTIPNGPTLALLANGDGVNYTAGEGNPIEIMDLSFGVQVSAINQLLTDSTSRTPGVHALSREADDAVASAFLDAQGALIDTPTDAQQEFLAGWRTTRFDKQTAPQHPLSFDAVMLGDADLRGDSHQQSDSHKQSDLR